MNARHVLVGFGILTAIVFAAPEVLSRDRPGTPLELQVKPAGPNAVEFRFFNTATETVRHEFEIEIDGQRLDPRDERFLSAWLGRWSHDYGYVSGRITNDLIDNRLYPDTRFCMRVWTRTLSDVQSQVPTTWVCTVLAPDRPPPKPDLDTVRFIHPESTRDRRLAAEFLVPPLTRDVAIDYVIIEHKDTRYPGWAHAFKKEYKVRNQNSVHETYERVDFPSPKLDATYQFRVCLQNAAGTVCSSQRPTLAIVNPRIKEQVQTPEFEVAQEDGGQLNETRIEELSRTPSRRNVAAVDPRRGSSAAQTQSAEANRGSIPLQQAAQQSRAAKAATEPGKSPTMPAPGTGSQSPPATAKSGTLATQSPASGAAAARQPNVAATHPAQTQSAGVMRGSTPLQQAAQQSPAAKAAMEPGTSPTTPAPGTGSQRTSAATAGSGTLATQSPASGTPLIRQPGTTLYSRAAPAQPATASTASAPLSRSPAGTIPPELAAEAAGKELIDIRCRGGNTFNLHQVRSDDQTPEAPVRFLLSFQLPAKNAAGNSPPAGEMGENLGPSQCAFADREFSWDNPPGIMFDVPATEANAAANADCPRICQELREPATLWTFTTFKTNYGHFRAIAHERWRPAVTGAGQN